jgi:hypothetical protein
LPSRADGEAAAYASSSAPSVVLVGVSRSLRVSLRVKLQESAAAISRVLEFYFFSSSKSFLSCFFILKILYLCLNMFAIDFSFIRLFFLYQPVFFILLL